LLFPLLPPPPPPPGPGGGGGPPHAARPFCTVNSQPGRDSPYKRERGEVEWQNGALAPPGERLRPRAGQTVRAVAPAGEREPAEESVAGRCRMPYVSKRLSWNDKCQQSGTREACARAWRRRAAGLDAGLSEAAQARREQARRCTDTISTSYIRFWTSRHTLHSDPKRFHTITHS
jgi:hypothetical protein